jgi:flavodoxin
MTHLVLYDSQFGNTEQIAQAVGRGIGGDVLVLPAKDGSAIGWNSLKLVVVGSPTQGGRPTVALQKIFDTIHPGTLAKAKVAAFDTRFQEKDSNFALRILMKSIGYASEKIAKTLASKGGTLAAPPEGFIVTGKEGPLKDGELARAEQWGSSLIK